MTSGLPQEQQLIDDIVIANKALIKVAQSTISSLDNIESKSSRLLKILLPTIKDFIFRLHPWNCLRERKVVIKSGDIPEFGYEYKYALPTDPYCLRPLAIQDGSGNWIPFYNASFGGSNPTDLQYTIEGRYILTDTEPHNRNRKKQMGLNLVYTQRPSNLNILDSNVIELLATHTAIEICYDLTGSVTLKQSLQAEFKDLLKIARALNAQEIAPGIPIGAVLGAHI